MTRRCTPLLACTSRLVRWLVGCVVLLSCGACGPTIGDACETSSECGTGAICDEATEGGYCTMTPCRPGECPAEAVCVDFGTERTWCMRRCDDGQGCREGLTCRDDIGEVPFCGISPPS